MKQLLLALGVFFIMALPIISLANKKEKIPPPKTVTGVVLNESGEPLAGVTINLKISRKNTITTNDGRFSIDVPENETTLVFSYIGMQTQEVNISGKTNISVQLKAADNIQTDVVVVGYGTQRKVDLTGAVSTVSGAKLIERPAPNAGNLLQGRVSGLQVTQPSAEPGRDNANLLIRGRGSFAGGTNNSPLVLIDGVTGSLNNISPDDIENVTVLKDASSAAIYGARAANGVVLITTKKGRSGKGVISYTMNVGRHYATKLPDLINNSAEYMELYNQAAARSAVAFRYSQTDIDLYRNSTDRNLYPNFNTIDYYFNPATVVNQNLSFSGGTEKSTYNVSLGYLDQEALLPGYKYKRYTGLFNYVSKVTNGITIGTTMNIAYKDRKEPPFTSENLALAVYAAGPLYGPFLPDGSGRVVSRAYQNEGRNRNPQEYYLMGDQVSREYSMNMQAYIDIKLMKGLTWSSKVAVNYIDEFYKMHQVPYAAYLLQEKTAAGDYVMSTFGPDVLGVTDQYSKTITPTAYTTLTYDTKIANDHSIKVLAGYEQLFFKFQTLRGRRTSSVAPALTELTGYSATGESLFFTFPRLPGLTGPSEWAMQSFFGRLNYSFKNKYLLEGNIRYDGTSKVSPSYRWGVFPSVSAGWVVSQENFLRDKFSWLSNFKVRASYGTLGNQDVGTYLYQPSLIISPVYPFGNTTPVQGAVVNTFTDQSIKWESTSILDFGFDFNYRRGLLGVSFDWFRKTTFDILASQQIPLSIGLGNPTINNGKMQNQGVEIELTHNNKIGQVTYGANFLFSTAKNKVLAISTPSKGTSINEVGLPYGSHYLYEWIGIFQVEDTIAGKRPKHALNQNPRPGDLMMKDQDGDGDVDADDRIVVKGAYPDYIYSFGFNVGYKGFELSTFFQGVQGMANRVNNWGVDPFFQGTSPSTKWRNAWTPQNRSNTIPAIYAGTYPGVTSYTGSTYYLMDASYLRCKNVNLSYNFPKAISSKIKANDLTVYVSADNLFTITSYDGSDPERSSTTGNYAQYPQARIFNFGLNVKF
jgi:TonB-linked SusC/RagA family outer membrane protein